MIPIYQWLISVGVGVFVSVQTMRFLKVANEDQESHIAEGMDASAVQADSEKPYIMGSEQISAALQQIFSSDNNDLENCPKFINGVPDSINTDYALGSESLNSMLGDMLMPPNSDNAKLPHIEPAIQL